MNNLDPTWEKDEEITFILGVRPPNVHISVFDDDAIEKRNGRSDTKHDFLGGTTIPLTEDMWNPT